ncbi:hypothetical protein [Halosolutus halophilus]|uniref:hypothetical protein n=1 Tax=Halosolutus halophilus TaxID=1552990 RepID=UPI0022352BE9|nr:hypothetical protein [Halosolutus halophilus]
MAGSSRASVVTPTSQNQDGIPAELPSAIEIDAEDKTVTLPLFQGRGPDDEDVHYVLTETSGLDHALRLGLNWAPKLRNALETPAVQEVSMGMSEQFEPRNSQIRFAGTVDFSSDRNVAPGPDGFPLDAENTQPGSVGDDAYSPFVTTPSRNVVFNAPHVENSTGEHDGLVEIDKESMTVTLELVEGFYEERGELYLSTDAYPADVAALEGATHAPTLSGAPAAGDRDLESSAREPIFPIVNGPMGEDNPERQGLRSAVAGEGGPLNVTRSDQVCHDPQGPTDCSLFYSPLWDVHPIVWTEAAIEEGRRRRLTDREEIIELVLAGDLASAADGPVNSLLGNVRAANAAVNCPIISVEEEGSQSRPSDPYIA